MSDTVLEPRSLPDPARATAATRDTESGARPVPAAGGPRTSRWRRQPPARLSVRAHRLIIELKRIGEPVSVLARRFPHVLNRIADAWPAPGIVVDLIDDLLVDRRGARRGFPADALAELLLTRQLCVQRLASRSGATRSDP